MNKVRFFIGARCNNRFRNSLCVYCLGSDRCNISGFALLFSDYTRWNIDEARTLFEELAEGGSADAQLGLAFLYGTGIGVPESSQTKALLYYTFSALGGNPLAQMALVCSFKLLVFFCP